MGLFQILTNPENFKFYSQAQNSGPNNKTLFDSFGQKSFTFGNSNQPYIVIPPPDSVQFLTPIDFVPGSDLNLFPNFELFSLGGGGGGDFSGTTFTKGNLFPYLGSVFKSIPNQLRYNPQSWGPDFLNRGNLFGYLRAIDDVKRLTKYFFDFKSFSGPLFIIKQNLLSTIGVKTESSRGTAYGGGIINEGIYSPTSTLAQAGVGFLGVFLNKQGLDPTGLTPQLKINSYQDSIYNRQYNVNDPINTGQKENRLISLNNKSSITSFGLKYENTNLFVGYTLIPNADTLLKYDGGPGSVYGIGTTKIKYATDNTGKNPITLPRTPAEILDIKGGNVFTWTNSDFISQPLNIDQSTTEDFRKKLLDDSFVSSFKKKEIKTFISSTLPYNKNSNDADGNSNTGNIETRIHLGNPSQRGDRSNPLIGKKYSNTNTLIGPQDLINASPIISLGKASDNQPPLKDLIDFNIGVYDNSGFGGANTTINVNYMFFRVFLKNFSDSYYGTWKDIEYMGRGEKFYRYTGFKRDISISFIVAAFTKEELLPIYKKLNYLASSTAPYYSDEGYMSGNLHRITLGNWINEQSGFISSVDLSIPEESPWEVNLSGSKDVQQLPHMVEVKLKFTPIHRFRPEILKNPTADDETLGKQYYFGRRKISLSPISPSPTQNNTTTDIITNSEGEYQDDLINKYPTFTNPNTQIKKPIQDQINLINPNLT
jgi:hypothetical protein